MTRRLSHPFACPNRTCLWSCVGRAAFPDKRPDRRSKTTGSRRRTGEPRLNGGSRLKATTDRAFSSLLAFHGQLTEEASLSCRACGSGSPFPIEGRKSLASVMLTGFFSVHGAAPDFSACRGKILDVAASAVFRVSIARKGNDVACPLRSFRVLAGNRPSKGCRDDRSYPGFSARPP